MTPTRSKSPEDLLTARQIAEEYHLPKRTAENLVRRLGRQGKLVTFPGFRRCFVKRQDVEPQSGGTTCE